MGEPECPQFQDALIKPESAVSAGGQRFPGRTLFGTTLDSKGYHKGLSEEKPVSAEAQPPPQLEKRQGQICKADSERVTGRGQGGSPDSSRVTRSGGGSTDDKARRAEVKGSLRAVPFSCDGRIGEAQAGGDRSPTPRTPQATTGGQLLCETPRPLPSREVECVIPKNIKHKFRSQVVDELLTDDEVNKFMKQKEASSKNLDSEHIPVQEPEKPSDFVNWYERIGYPLRCNVFPGSSSEWQSEAQSTYTKEVHQRFKRDPEHWHGRTTDQLGHWVEMSIVHRKMKKALDQLEKQMANSSNH